MYDLYHVGGWDFSQEEFTGTARKITQAATPEGARQLRDEYARGIAYHRYGPGDLVVTDGRGERVGRVTPALELAPASA